MAFLIEEFNVNELPVGNNNFEPLPAGWYSATISQSELKDTKAGNGQYIKLRFDITGPTHQGRVVFGNLNIKNPNPKAEEIGRTELGNIMRAIGLAKVTDTDQLIGGELVIKLEVKHDETYPVIPAADKSTAPVAAPTKAAPPWARK